MAGAISQAAGQCGSGDTTSGVATPGQSLIWSPSLKAGAHVLQAELEHQLEDHLGISVSALDRYEILVLSGAARGTARM